MNQTKWPSTRMVIERVSTRSNSILYNDEGKKAIKQMIKTNNILFLFYLNREFEVESKNFEGKTHRWVLSRLLQKGYEKSNESFFQVRIIDLCTFIYVIKKIIILNNTFLGHGKQSSFVDYHSKETLLLAMFQRFRRHQINRSIRLRFHRFESFSFLKKNKLLDYKFLNIFQDIFIGLPQMRVVDYQSKLNLEKIKFLVGELRIDVNIDFKYFKHIFLRITCINKILLAISRATIQ